MIDTLPITPQLGEVLKRLSTAKVTIETDGLMAFTVLLNLRLALAQPDNSGPLARMAAIFANDLMDGCAPPGSVQREFAMQVGTMGEPESLLTVYSIYDHPSGYPDHFVLRGFKNVPGSPEPVPIMAAELSPDVEILRDLCRQRGLQCIGREERDDPKIIESWI